MAHQDKYFAKTALTLDWK